MCFSPQASFIASGSLTVLGIASWKLAKGKEKVVAALPLLFAAQQLIEGGQWLFLQDGSYSNVLAYAYLFFAFLVWPVYVPLLVFLMDKKSSSVMRWFLIAGCI